MSAVIVSKGPAAANAAVAVANADNWRDATGPSRDNYLDHRLLGLLGKLNTCREIARHLGLTVPATKLRLSELYRRAGTPRDLRSPMAHE